jgi:uncharacterized protein with FMN-binding domain
VVVIKKKWLTVLVVLGILAAAAVAGGAGAMAKINTNLQRLAGLPVSNVEVAKLADGTYTGSYRVFPVSAEVRVTVKNHVITEIELLRHRHGQGKAAEVIPGKVMEAQSLQVDVISGATYSSKVILKAIENALTGS